MTRITKDKFSGGAGVATGDLADDLRDVADDLASVKAGASIAAGAVSATAAADIVALAQPGPTAVTTTDIAAVAAPGPAPTVVVDVGETYGVADGLIIGAPTNPSTQAVDPGAVIEWNANIAAGYAFANAVGMYWAAQVDFKVSTGAKRMDIAQAMYAWIVIKENGAGVVAMHVVLGTAAALGAEVIPNDAAIDASVTHARWCKLALCHASRTADAVVGCTQDPSFMKKWGGAGTTLINDLKAKYNVAVTAIAELVTLAGTVRTMANDLKAKYNVNVTAVAELQTVGGTLRTLANEVKADLAEARAIANEVRTDLNALGSATLKTTKG